MEDQLVDTLGEVATETPMALVIELDAVSTTPNARSERELVHALDALGQTGVQIVLVSAETTSWALDLRASLPHAWWFDRHCGWREGPEDVRRRESVVPFATVLAYVQERMPQARLITVGEDGRIALRAARTQLSLTGTLSLRAALWWLVNARTRRSAPRLTG